MSQQEIDRTKRPPVNPPVVFLDAGEALVSQAAARPYRLVGTVIPAIGRGANEGRIHHLYKYVKHVCDKHVHDAFCHSECMTVCNNSDHAVEEPRDSGIYVCPRVPDLLPMCIYGWNRYDGMAFSILRGNIGKRECRTCAKNVAAGKEPAKPRAHKTRDE